MNKEYCYSSDGEMYSFDEERDAILDIVELLGETDEDVVGNIVTIYCGDVDYELASRYSPLPGHILECMSEDALDKCGDFSEGWLDVSKEAVSDLGTMVKATIDSWADKHNCQPTFYKVNNTKEKRFRITKYNDDRLEYEEVEDV